tara:strand:- start:3354 stop:3551 length:198 start_codon:yes stop_codon:yes gene_type:complete
LIEFRLGETMVNIQAIPLYGLFLGLIYYNPNLEPDNKPVDPDEFYHQVTLAFLIVGIHITVWKLL